MLKTIYLDMDGTFVDLYGQPHWRESLEAKEVTPYVNAKPLVNLAHLARNLNTLQRKGYEIGIISWNCKGADYEYAQEVKQAKLEWLAKHMPSVKFDKIHIVAFGTPKHLIGIGGDKLLFDDEYANLTEWEESGGRAFHARDLANIMGLVD